MIRFHGSKRFGHSGSKSGSFILPSLMTMALVLQDLLLWTPIICSDAVGHQHFLLSMVTMVTFLKM
jgi:hypothetical protein